MIPGERITSKGLAPCRRTRRQDAPSRTRGTMVVSSTDSDAAMAHVWDDAPVRYGPPKRARHLRANIISVESDSFARPRRSSGRRL